MSPGDRKVNNSYETDPSSSNGSTVDTPAALDRDDLGVSPKLSSLFNYNNQRTPHSKPTISEMAERERVEMAKVYFQRVFASSHQSEFDNISPTEYQETEKHPLKSILKPTPKRPSIDQCFSSEISNQDERCRREIVNVRLYHLNSDISDGSEFTIEPNSSLDADQGSTPKMSSTKCDFTQSMFSADNSCNAVDNQIATESEHVTGGELSFNGIIDSITKSKSVEVAKQQKRMKLKLLENEQSLMQVNEQSPDLFEESDGDEETTDRVIDEDDIKPCTIETDITLNDKRSHILKSEKVILGQIQSSLSGLLPPPSVTILQYNILEILSMYKKNVVHMDTENNFSQIKTIGTTSEFVPTHKDTDTKQLKWPDCMDAKTHGIYYNRSLYSENIELLVMRYAERNIGAETSSTFNLSTPSSSKKRNMRMKMLAKSPGNRLSHLAKRRAIFSSANLLKSNSKDLSKLGRNQLVIDTRNRDRRNKTVKVKTPKRRTPGGRKRTPGRKTPGSARKRAQLSLPLKNNVPATRETSKRALFQSPPKEKPKPKFPAEIASRVEKSKRVLFSPVLPSHSRQLRSPPDCNDGESSSIDVSSTLTRSTSNIGRTISNHELSSNDSFQAPPKRKREDDSMYMIGNPAKLQRLGSTSINIDNLTPRTLMKSQSFSVAPSSSLSGEFGQTKTAAAMLRANSEQNIGSVRQLSQLHRQKIFWAVATALKNKKISSQHANYKQFASVLAKVIKRFFLEMAEQKGVSTSATMLKIADKHVFWVLQGKTEDEIYLNEKNKLDSTVNLPKLSGYVPVEEYELRKNLLRRSTSGLATVSSDTSFDSSMFGGVTNSQQSITASQIMQATTSNSQQSDDYSSLCDEHLLQLSASKSGSKTTPALTNSSSKSNTKNGVLRENMVDPRSAQKSFAFSGRDQKNVSPYSDKSGTRHSSNNKKTSGKLLIGGGGSISANIMKAKRQISFDS